MVGISDAEHRSRSGVAGSQGRNLAPIRRREAMTASSAPSPHRNGSKTSDHKRADLGSDTDFKLPFLIASAFAVFAVIGLLVIE
jgi:hypothetical protein